jgi:hypothetical protein
MSAASAVLKKIRYGTALKPTLNARICSQFPARAQYPLVDPEKLTCDDRPFAGLSPWVCFALSALKLCFRVRVKRLPYQPPVFHRYLF